MLYINVVNGGEVFFYKTKQYDVESFKAYLTNVNVGNIKYIFFHDEYNNIDVCVSPVASLITFKGEE